MVNKVINILGIRPNGCILSRFETYKKDRGVIIIEPITEQKEIAIDKQIENNSGIFRNKRGELIPTRTIYFYGEIDLNKKEDIETIKKYNICDVEISDNFVYSNVDYENGTVELIDNVIKGYNTWNPLVWFRFNHLLIGKPKRIVVYKHPYFKFPFNVRKIL